jgi:uncharacterized protein YbaP (TraB family)
MNRSPRSALRLSIALSLALLVPVHAQNTATGRHFLWKVEGRRTPLYLLGSIHLLSSAYYPLPDVINQAFDGAETLIEEVDLDELTSPATMSLIMSKALLQEGKTLDALLTKDTYAQLQDYLKTAGMPADGMKRFKPWMVGLTITALEAQKAGFDPNLGVDKHFFDRAKKTGKRVKGLETAAYQIDRLDELVPADQDALIRQTLSELETERNNLKTMADAWAGGDAAVLESLLLKEFKDTPRIYDRLLVERNKNWMPTLEACLDAPRPCFVVVGAAHLVGPDGLLSMLKQKGLTADQK